MLVGLSASACRPFLKIESRSEKANSFKELIKSLEPNDWCDNDDTDNDDDDDVDDDFDLI